MKPSFARLMYKGQPVVDKNYTPTGLVIKKDGTTRKINKVEAKEMMKAPWEV